MKKNNITITLIDAISICCPIIFLFFILIFEGDAGSMLNRSEWSFITVYFLMEVLRDQASRVRDNSYHIQHAEGGHVLYALILVLGVLVLAADFKHSIHPDSIPDSVIYVAKFSFFAFSFVLFLYHRFKKLKGPNKTLNPDAAESAGELTQ
jgi:hypothetical protein